MTDILDRFYVVKYHLTYLNEHDKANRANKYGGANLKDQETSAVALLLNGQPAIKKPCRIKFIWHYSTKHDFDNIRFACKYVLDGMIKAGILPSDSPKWVRGFDGDDFVKCKPGQEKVLIEVKYIDEDS